MLEAAGYTEVLNGGGNATPEEWKAIGGGGGPSDDGECTQ